MKKSQNKYVIYYFVLIGLGSILMIYFFYKNPGLFPFSILDVLLSIIMNIICGVISFIISYLLSFVFNKKNKLIIFIIVYLIIYILYILKRFII